MHVQVWIDSGALAGDVVRFKIHISREAPCRNVFSSELSGSPWVPVTLPTQIPDPPADQIVWRKRAVQDGVEDPATLHHYYHSQQQRRPGTTTATTAGMTTTAAVPPGHSQDREESSSDASEPSMVARLLNPFRWFGGSGEGSQQQQQRRRALEEQRRRDLEAAMSTCDVLAQFEGHVTYDRKWFKVVEVGGETASSSTSEFLEALETLGESRERYAGQCGFPKWHRSLLQAGGSQSRDDRLSIFSSGTYLVAESADLSSGAITFNGEMYAPPFLPPVYRGRLISISYRLHLGLLFPLSTDPVVFSLPVQLRSPFAASMKIEYPIRSLAWPLVLSCVQVHDAVGSNALPEQLSAAIPALSPISPATQFRTYKGFSGIGPSNGSPAVPCSTTSSATSENGIGDGGGGGGGVTSGGSCNSGEGSNHSRGDVTEESRQQQCSNPYLMGMRPAVQFAEELFQEIVEREHLKTKVIRVSEQGHNIASVSFDSQVFNPGDVIHVVVDLTTADIPCFQISAFLELVETLHPTAFNTVRQPFESKYAVSETTEHTLHVLETHLDLGIPSSVPPQFSSTAVSVHWELRLEFWVCRPDRVQDLQQSWQPDMHPPEEAQVVSWSIPVHVSIPLDGSGLSSVQKLYQVSFW